MISTDKLLSVIRQRGPSMPAELASILKENSMMVGAYLSDLIKQKRLLLTKGKWDGSPLYYLPDQTTAIQKLAEKFNDKNRAAFELLKEEKILCDEEQTPLMRACLRAIKDFADPVTIRTPTGEKLYWRWYLATDEQITQILRERFTKSQQMDFSQPQAPQPPKVVEEQPKVQEVSAEPQPKEDVTKKEEPTSVPIEKPQEDEPKKSDSQSTLVDSVTPKTASIEQSYESDDELSQITKQLAQKDIVIDKYEIVRKKTEFDCIATMKTKATSIKFFAKIKVKKRINEGDLSQCYVKAQKIHLTPMFITTGDLTKKAEKFLQEELPSLVFIQI